MAGTVSGTVTNATGTMLPATVTSNAITIYCAPGTTPGYYKGRFGSSGFYTIVATAPGYQKLSITRELADMAINTVNLVLTPV